MCFSAPASFIASGGLIALGSASIATAKKEDRILAAIPFLFGIQQGFEGMQWLSIQAGTSSLVAGYGFLFFAFIVWPIYVPLFVYVLEKKRRRIIRWFLMLGIAVGLYFLSLLLTETLTIHKVQQCISYNFTFPLKDIVNVGYLVAVFGPLFISSKTAFKWFGVVVAALAIISWIFYTRTFASVWCFFAAIVSSLFFVYVQREHRN